MSEAGVSSAQLLERTRELDALDEAIALAAAGEGRCITVSGPAGIGKSRLLAETRQRAEEAGLQVLRARGGELEREFGFGVVRQLFERAVVADDALLAGAAAPARPVFAADEAGGDAAEASFAVLHALYWLVVNLSAERPLLLAVDDLHWSDHASLRFLAYLARRLEGLPALVVAGVREAEPGLDTALIGEIEGDPANVVLRPDALSEEAVDELVRDRLGGDVDPAVAAACRRLTGGNPFLLDELLKAVEADDIPLDAQAIEELGPRAASRSVLLRLSRLGEDAVAVARSLAVLGDGADVRVVAALAELDDRRTAAAVDTLTRAQAVRSDSPLGFVHPLVAAAVYQDLPPGERLLRHERAADLLRDAAAPAERIAAHLLVLPPRHDGAVVETLRRAAAAALGRGAAESAVTYLGRALTEPPAEHLRTHVVLDLGRAEVVTNGAAAAQHLGEAFERLDGAAERAAVARQLVVTLLYTGAGAEASAIARRTAEELPAELADVRKELEALEYATALFGIGDVGRLAQLSAHRPASDRRGVGEKALAALSAYEWACAGGPAEECSRLALESLSGGELVASYNGFLSILPIAVLAAADREEAPGLLEECLAAAHAGGSVFSASSTRTWRAWTLYRRGELDEAEREFDAALEAGRPWGFGVLNRIYRGALKTSLHLDRGDLARARDVLYGFGDPGSAASRFVAGDAADPDTRADVIRFWLNARLELLVAEGSFDEALVAADGIADRFSHVVNPAVGPWRSLKARALERVGRGQEAIALAAEEVELARAWGGPWALGRSLRELGTLTRDRDLLEEAVAVLEPSPARLEHAKALAALGSMLRLARKPSEAREPLRRALELAERCGAAGLAEHTRSEIYATGARPRKAALSGVESLTTSEHRVAALAAEGQTNRDIAQALYVTPKTIEVHLSNAYRKLGIRSRRELAGALGAA